MGEVKKTQALPEASYRRTRGVQKSTVEMTGIFMAEILQGFLGQKVIAAVDGQMVKPIADTLGEKRKCGEFSYGG